MRHALVLILVGAAAGCFRGMIVDPVDTTIIDNGTGGATGPGAMGGAGGVGGGAGAGGMGGGGTGGAGAGTGGTAGSGNPSCPGNTGPKPPVATGTPGVWQNVTP